MCGRATQTVFRSGSAISNSTNRIEDRPTIRRCTNATPASTIAALATVSSGIPPSRQQPQANGSHSHSGLRHGHPAAVNE